MGRPRIHSPAWLLGLLAGRIPALATNVVFWSLAARIPVLLKPSSKEPVFAGLLASTIPEPLRGSVRVLEPDVWSDSIKAAVIQAPVCLAYGDDQIIDAVSRMRDGCPTLVGGHRESLVVVFDSAMRQSGLGRLSAAIADDVAIYDQGGCLSPTVVLAEEGGEVTPAELANAIQKALMRGVTRLPPGRLGIEAAAAVRTTVEMVRARAMRIPGPESGKDLFPFVAVLREPPVIVGQLFRTVQVVPFRGRLDAAEWLPHLAGKVQGMAVAGDRSRAQAWIREEPSLRPCRVCGAGRLQRPPAIWSENGIVVTRSLAHL